MVSSISIPANHVVAREGKPVDPSESICADSHDGIEPVTPARQPKLHRTGTIIIFLVNMAVSNH